MSTDNLDGVFVCTYGTVRAESIELALCRALFDDGNLSLGRKALECDVIKDADGEVCLRLLAVQIVEYCDNLCRGGVLG